MNTINTIVWLFPVIFMLHDFEEIIFVEAWKRKYKRKIQLFLIGKFDKTFFMKSSEEIKKELHEYIDSINDEETLWALHEDVLVYLKTNKAENIDEDEVLSEDQQKQLDEAIRQADAGEVMDFDEFKRRMSLWHTK